MLNTRVLRTFVRSITLSLLLITALLVLAFRSVRRGLLSLVPNFAPLVVGAGMMALLGRSFDSHGQGRHTLASEKSDPKTRLATVFAKEIAERISKAKQDAEFDKLVVIAAPRFLGVLRPALATAGIDVEHAFDKEMTAKDLASIQELVDSE